MLVEGASEQSDQGNRPSKQRLEFVQTDIAVEAESNPEVSAEVDTVSEQAITRLEEAKELLTTPTEQTRGGALKQLTIEVQTRKVAGRTEYRTIVNPGVTDQSHTWSGVGNQQLQQWIQQHLGEVI